MVGEVRAGRILDGGATVAAMTPDPRGVEAAGGTPEDLARRIDRGYAACEKLIRETGLKLN